MKKGLITKTVASLFLLLAVGDVIWTLESQSVESIVSAKVGAPAPDFKVKDTNGKEHTLATHKGKYVVLEWVNYECPFVKKHYDGGNMQSLQKKYTDKGVVWLSVNSSAPGRQGAYDAAQVNKLLAEKGASPTAYLLDPDGVMGRSFGAKTTPHMYIIDPKGNLIYAGAIDDKVSTDKEDAKTARNYVQTALDSAMAGKPVSDCQTQAYGCSIKYTK